MKNLLIGATVACVLSVGATAAFAQQGASGQGGLVSGTRAVSGDLQSPPARGRTPPTGTPPPFRQAPRSSVPPKVASPAPMVDVRNGPQAFSVVLVVGEMDGTPGADTVPAAARKALTDLKDFLPYKNYRLLDSQWTLCCGRGAIFSRLRGLDEQEYELQLTPTVAPTISNGVDAQQPVVNVRFVLTEAASGRVESTRQSGRLLRDLHAAQEEGKSQAGGVSPTSETMRLVEQQVPANRRSHVPRQVMDASFRMDVGETVVVGTSRIQGDKALIALLTAVPPKGGAGR